MWLINFALKNPYAVLALSIGLCLLSITVVPTIPIDILPDFETPVVVSFFSYQGLPTMDMEKSVTSRVERALTLAGGIEHQESRTVSGASVIKVFFQPGTDPHAAMNDIVNLEASDMFHLPPGIEWPFTLRSEPANLPVILAAISGEGLSETELYHLGYYAVRNKMGGLKGVQIPHPFGGKFKQMMVYVDPTKLRAYGLSATDVVEALRKSNLVLAAGTAKIGKIDYQIHPNNTLPKPSDIDAVPIAVRDGDVREGVDLTLVGKRDARGGLVALDADPQAPTQAEARVITGRVDWPNHPPARATVEFYADASLLAPTATVGQPLVR